MMSDVRSLNIFVILSLVSSSYAYHAIPIQAYFSLPGRPLSGQQVWTCFTTNYLLLQDFDVRCHFFSLTKQSIISSQSSFGKLLYPPEWKPRMRTTLRENSKPIRWCKCNHRGQHFLWKAVVSFQSCAQLWVFRLAWTWKPVTKKGNWCWLIRLLVPRHWLTGISRTTMWTRSILWTISQHLSQLYRSLSTTGLGLRLID